MLYISYICIHILGVPTACKVVIVANEKCSPYDGVRVGAGRCGA